MGLAPPQYRWKEYSWCVFLLEGCRSALLFKKKFDWFTNKISPEPLKQGLSSTSFCTKMLCFVPPPYIQCTSTGILLISIETAEVNKLPTLMTSAVSIEISILPVPQTFVQKHSISEILLKRRDMKIKSPVYSEAKSFIQSRSSNSTQPNLRSYKLWMCVEFPLTVKLSLRKLSSYAIIISNK